MLDVERCEYIDAGIQQFFDILPALRMTGTGRIGMRQFIHQDQRWLALQGRIQVELRQLLVAILHLFQRQQFEAVQHGGGFGAAVAFDHAGQHLAPFTMQFVGGAKHRVGFSNAGRCTKIDAQLAAPSQALLHLQLGQQGIWIGAQIAA